MPMRHDIFGAHERVPAALARRKRDPPSGSPRRPSRSWSRSRSRRSLPRWRRRSSTTAADGVYHLRAPSVRPLAVELSECRGDDRGAAWRPSDPFGEPACVSAGREDGADRGFQLDSGQRDRAAAERTSSLNPRTGCSRFSARRAPSSRATVSERSNGASGLMQTAALQNVDAAPSAREARGLTPRGARSGSRGLLPLLAGQVPPSQPRAQPGLRDPLS